MADIDDKKVSRQVETAKALLSALLDGKGATLGQMQGLERKDLEALYAVGYNFYRSGRFDDAAKVFQYLCLLDHLTIKFWLALGGAEQMRKNYQGALKAYAYASMMDLEEPRAQLHAAECSLALGDRANAESALGALLEYCPRTPEMEKYRRKAEALLGLLKLSGAKRTED